MARSSRSTSGYSDQRLVIAGRPIVTRPDPGPLLLSPRTAPSIHVRAALTWLAIFPLVAIGSTAMAPFTAGWDPLLRAFVLTLVVVALAVYLVEPWLMGIYDRFPTPR